LLGVPPGHDAAALGARLLETVTEHAPDLLPWLPLIATVADVEVEPTPEVRDLSEEFRKPKLESVTTELLARLITEPTLVALEDAHWMDEASADLLTHIAGRIGELPWLVCVTRRDEETGFVAPEASRVRSLRLSPLSTEATSELIERATDESPLLPHEVEELGERSAGNPLFLQELVHALKRAGSLQEVPASIEGMVTAQIDRLTPNDRRILRYAAVLGTTFDAELVKTLLDERDGPVDPGVWRRLREFVADEGGGMYRFHHALMRDAAYEGLPYRRRRELHARVGETIAGADGDPDERAELLSTHFFLAGRLEPAWRFSVVAARRAAGLYANLEAARFYRRAIDAGRRLRVDETEIAQTYEALGDVLERAGHYPDAGAAYLDARRSLNGDPRADAALMLKRARIDDRAGKPSAGIRWLSRANRALQGATGDDAEAQRARIAADIAAIRSGQGRARDAIRWAEEAIARARTVDELDARANAHYLIAWTRMNQGDTDQSSHLDEALELYERTGNLLRQSDCLTVSGAVAYWAGEWTDAVRKYQLGRELSERAGDVVGAAVATMNIAEIRSDQGRLAESEPLAREAQHVFRASEYLELTALVTSMLGRMASRGGRHDEAAELYERALQLSEEAGSQLLGVGITGLVAEDAVRRSEPDEALRRCEEADDRASHVGGPGVHEALLERIRGFAYLALGDMAHAEHSLDRSLARARSDKLIYELGLTLRAYAKLRLAREESSEAENAEAAEILGRLGVSIDVVDLPAVPAPPRVAV
jgi:tetratricopeptide (TPR) repeat protein